MKNYLNIFKNNNSIIVITEKLIVAVSRFIYLYFIIKQFGSAGQGDFSYVNTIWNVALIFILFGFDVSIIYYISKKTFEVLNAIISNSIIFFIVTFVFGFIAFYFLQKYTPVFQKIPLNFYYISLSGAFIFLVRQILRSILYGLGKFLYQFWGTVFVNITFLVTVLVFYVFKINNLGLLLSMFLLLTVISMIYWIVTINKLKWKFKFKVDKTLLFNQLKYGSKVYLNSILISLNLRLDAFIIMYFLDSKKYGYYFVAVAISEIVNYIPQALTVVILNRVSKRKTIYDLSLFPEIVAILIFSALLVGLFGSFLIPAIYGSEYSKAIIPLVILVIGAVPMGLTTIASYYLLGIDKGKVLIFPSFFALIATVVFDLLLIPVWGITGAAVASSISYSVMSIIILLFLFKYGKVDRDKVVKYLVPSFSGAYILLKNKIKV